jgi:PPK2 family polyphosphate:nucleotide phosphotransferase
MKTMERFKVAPGSKVRLKKMDPAFTDGHKSHKSAADEIAHYQQKLRELQDLLYAEHGHSLLICLQAMDTGGKDGVINHVLGAMNPQGCRVAAFKQPSPLEASHDFLWRAHKAAPARGEVVIFNRSHYEDVLVTRVHDLVPEKVWRKRYGEIATFESLLAANSTIIMKFYLHISKDVQRERLLAREADPAKSWKLSAADWKERQYWEKYNDAYAEAIGKTGVKDAPWFIVPSNNKSYRNHAIADKITSVLRKYKSEWDETLAKTGELRKAELVDMRAQYPAMAAEAGPQMEVKKKTKKK